VTESPRQDAIPPANFQANYKSVSWPDANYFLPFGPSASANRPPGCYREREAGRLASITRVANLGGRNPSDQ
jgi:hypothetical protein